MHVNLSCQPKKAALNWTYTHFKLELVEVIDGHDEVLQHPVLVSVGAEQALPVDEEAELLELSEVVLAAGIAQQLHDKADDSRGHLSNTHTHTQSSQLTTGCYGWSHE